MWSDEDCAYWRRHIADQYGLQADISGLDGEFDLNAAVFVDGSFHAVLKVMRPDCTADFVEMQVAALDHLAAQKDHAVSCAVMGRHMGTCSIVRAGTGWSGW